MKPIFWTAGVGVVLAVTLVSCNKVASSQTRQQQPPPPAATDPRTEQESEQAGLVEHAQQELDELGVRLAEFRARIATAQPQLRKRLDQQLDALEARWTELEQRLPELKSVTSAAWRQMHESFARSLGELKNAVERWTDKDQEKERT